jgi:hypothetical protein
MTQESGEMRLTRIRVEDEGIKDSFEATVAHLVVLIQLEVEPGVFRFGAPGPAPLDLVVG